MSAVEKITPHLHSLTCPDELRSLPCWLMWRFEQVPGEAKPRKVPYYAGGRKRSGTQGSPEDVAHLVTFEAAVSAAARKGFDGVGIATLPQNNVTIIDFDRAIVKGELLAEVDRACIGSYAEFSPSGEGVHLVVKGSWPNKKNHGDKADPSAYGVETFHSKGFVTWTGNPIPATEMCGAENTIAPMNESLLRILTSRLLTPREREQGDRPRQAAKPMGYHPEQISEMLAPIDPEQGHDQWLRIGMAIHHETDGEGFDLWDEWSETGSSYPGREQLQYRWDSFGRSGTAGVTIRSLLKVAHAAGATIGSVASADDFDVVEDTPGEKAEKAKTASRFQVIPAAEFARRPPPEWIVKNVLPDADLAMLFGESGSGKSFIMIDIAMAIARGAPWRGMKVRQGRVVYIAAEGGGGFRNRLLAYAQQHQIKLEEIPFGVIHAAPNFLEKGDAKAVAVAIKAGGPVALIIVDTYAQVTPGANENSAEDMGMALKNARVIKDETGGMMLLVHHAGKDSSKGARGWSGNHAAADAVLEVTRNGNQRALRTAKQKDGDDGAAWGFSLETVVVGMDQDGDVIDSCIAVEAAVGPKTDGKKEKPVSFGEWEELILETYAELALSGEGVMLTDLTTGAAAKREKPVSSKVRKASALRAVKNLCEAGPKRRFKMVEDVVFELVV